MFHNTCKQFEISPGRRNNHSSAGPKAVEVIDPTADHRPACLAQPEQGVSQGAEPPARSPSGEHNRFHPRAGILPLNGASTSLASTLSLVRRGQASCDPAERIKELVKLAQEQGYLTYNDINDSLGDSAVIADELDEIYLKLRNLEVKIVDPLEVDRVKHPEADTDEEKTRIDVLDDPVRMYFKQMGQVPLLTREQEVAISKRVEAAESEVKKCIYSFGFARRRAGNCARPKARPSWPRSKPA